MNLWKRETQNGDLVEDDEDWGGDGMYYSYKVDDFSLNGENLSLCKNLELYYDVDDKVVTTPSGSRANSLVLNISDLQQNNGPNVGFDFPSGINHDKKITFFTSLVNFFRNLICKNRSVLNFDPTVTISTISTLSQQSYASDISEFSLKSHDDKKHRIKEFFICEDEIKNNRIFNRNSYSFVNIGSKTRKNYAFIL